MTITQILNHGRCCWAPAYRISQRRTLKTHVYYKIIKLTIIAIPAHSNQTNRELSNHWQTLWFEGRPEKNVSEKNPVGEKQTGNLGRNWAQAHKVILLGYIHEKNYEMRQIGVGLEWLPTCKRRVIILGTFTKGPRPTPCCSRAADIFIFVFKIYIFRLIRQHLKARNSISLVTIMAKKI